MNALMNTLMSHEIVGEGGRYAWVEGLYPPEAFGPNLITRDFITFRTLT